MFLIIGLGNPEKKYEKNRHNAGFMAVDFLAAKNKWVENKKLKSLTIAKNNLDPRFRGDDSKEILIVKPQTYMNDSGMAVAAATNYYKIKPENTIVIYDELDLPFGTIRVKLGGSAAGHNGIKSIIEKLGTDKFWRVRIGISNEKREIMPADKFVLSNFTKLELKELKEKILPEVMKKIKEIL